MSRIAKWKLEKTKVKVVFRLQFHATHIPQTGWDKLFISFIPSDSGKATAKTTKANVRNGTCKWGDPIYETTRLLQDAKSKQYDEKLYKLVVAMGSSRASILGEATINLADYADALKPSAVSLPLHGCNFGTVLHVTVQLLTSKTGFREFEQQRELREKGLQSGAESKHDDSSPGKEATSSQLDKVNARVRFKDAKELASFEEEVGSHEESTDSALGFDDLSNTSESLYAEKHDSSSAHEIDSLRSTVSGDLNGLPHCQSLQTGKGDLSDKPLMVQGTSDSVCGWPSDGSVDNDLAMVYEENHRLRGSLELAESTIVELKQEISSLQGQANEIGIETQKFSHFLASEISSSDEMAKELSLLKSECLKFKDEIERLKDFKMNPQVTGKDGSLVEHHHLLQDRQLRWINGILNLENRIRELLQKTYLGFHERDIRFFPSELEELLRILQDIKQGTGEATSLLNMVPSERTDVDEIRGTFLSKNELLASGSELDLDLSLPESLLNHLSIPPLISQETDSVGAIDVMKRKTFDLMRELDEAKAERENLARKMDQMECYYEALIQELEENQKQMLGELQNLRNEHSTCLYTISSSKAEMESMRQNMSQQLLQLAEERRDLDAFNKELERRATTSEAALRRARLNYSIAVDKLQKDLELLSSQVVSMFETNENIIKQAFPESPRTQSLGYLNMFKNPGDSEDASLMQCQIPDAGVRKQPLGGDILLEDLKKSLYLQEELYQKVEGELHEMQFVNLYLDIFSKTLQETLFEANAEIGHMKGNLDELARHLELSNVAQDQLIIRLQTAMEDIRLLNDYKASCIAKFSDMALANQTSEAKLEIITKENGLLVQKFADYETITSENRSYQKIYEVCCAEKAELSNLLKRENTENVKLQNDISRLKEELKTSKAELDELALLKDNLQENVSFVQDKLASMLISYDQQFKGLNLLSNSHDLDLEVNNFKSAILQWEEMQYNACSRILELMEEKKTLDFERVLSETSLSAARSDILAIKKKLKSDIQKMAAKLDGSSALVGKLQFDLESIANKLQLSSQVEEKYAQQNNELLADLTLFEVELQQLTSKNGLLAQEILGLEDLAEELGTSKSAIADLMQEKQGLLMSVQDKIQETIKLASERDCLAENLRSLNHELQVERIVKEKLEGTISDLTSQLNKMQEKLLEYEQQQAELVHFRQLSSDLELEKSELNRLLLLHDDCLEKLREESSCLYHLQTQLLEMDDYMLAADVKFTFLLYQYETVCQDFVQRIRSSDGCLEELQKRHHEIEAMLNHSLVSEARYREENVKLMRSVNSLQSDLEASVAQNKFSSEANDDLRVQLVEYKKKLEVLEDGYNEDKGQHALQIDQLRNLLANAEEENVKLASTVKSLQSDLEASVAQNKFSSEANDVLLVQLEEYKKTLEVLEDGYNKDNDHLALQVEQLRNLLANAEEENVKLVSAVKSLQSDLETSVAQNKFSSEANDVLRVQLEEYRKKLDVLEDGYNKDKDHHALQIDQLRDSLANAEEENMKLASTVKSLQSDLEASVAQNKFSSVANDVLRVQLEEYKKLEALEDRYNKDKDHQALQVEQLRNLLANAEEENIELMRTVKSLQSDLEASVAQNTFSSEAKDVTRVQLEEYKKKLEALEDGYNKDKDHHALQVEQLRNLMANAEEEIDFLTSSIEELEITITVLKEKLDEQSASISLMEEYKDEILILQSRCNELTRKLSEQVLRTEEFKNLSIHLKELKDKAEAACLQAREKREPEGSPVVQESLRIAFIKEQYETRVQELRQQLSISKKHGEELLFKLQDAIDEIENRKKSEALHLKRNKELSLKLVELEADLQSALSEKCEKINAYDRINAELECTVLTLECCKEEKEKLEASLRECEEENNKIAIELMRTKGHLENVTSSIKIHKEENGGMNKTGHAPDESTGNLRPHFLTKDRSVYGEKVEHVSPSQDGDCEDSSMALKGQAVQEAANRGSRVISENALLGGASQQTDGKDVSKAHLNSINLRSSMEHLQEELERMKNENSLLSMDPQIDPDFQVLQAELKQLHKANEELRNIFPLVDEISSSGNALERVLALVIELAESLRAKSKSNIHFQSSFLKQHSDEEAVLKSFRDIHELIKEMLDLKGRYAALETDLKEMHNRYSQLSLQFAEVEGERQKLKMTLKNVRASKKLI